MVDYLRTNYRLTGAKASPEAVAGLESVILRGSTLAISSAGYAFDSTGYGVPSAMVFQAVSNIGPCASVKGDGTDSAIVLEWIARGSFSGSVFFASILVGHHGSGAAANETMSMYYAVDAYDTATPSTSTDMRIIYTLIVGST